MVKRIDRLESKVFAPGSKITITPDLRGAVHSGSLAFVSFFRRPHKEWMHGTIMKIIITRRGNGGQNRIESRSIVVPTFFVDDKKFLSAMPSDWKELMNIELVPISRSLVAASSMDFLGWACAYTNFLYEISKQHNMNHAWPGDPEDPVNICLRIESHFENHPQNILAKAKDREHRADLVIGIRAMEARLSGALLGYMNKVAYHNIKLCGYFESFNNDTPVITKSAINRSVKYFEEEYRAVMGLQHIRDQRMGG